ncbi:hypothetical protein HED63_25110 [Ochrobactrum cytisi]|nr:hypothetical protein [Brucella cytisi]
MGIYEEDRNSSQPNGTSKRGMIKLMLKLPSVRDDIKRSEGEPLLSLAEAYQIASEVLDKLRLSDKEDSSLLPSMKRSAGRLSWKLPSIVSRAGKIADPGAVFSATDRFHIREIAQNYFPDGLRHRSHFIASISCACISCDMSNISGRLPASAAMR